MNTVLIPKGLGKYYSYMNWDRVTSTTSNQYKFRETAKNNGSVSYDSNGYAFVDGRQVVALTSTFGNVGDYVDIKRNDGTTLKAVIGDIKNQNDEGANRWGHNQGQVIVEYITNWEDGHSNPTSNGGIESITNVGNYFDSMNQYSLNNSTQSDNTGIEIQGIDSASTNTTLGIIGNIIKYIAILLISVISIFFILKALGIEVI